MKLSNFELVKTVGSSPIDWQYFAEVDVESGALWWKKKKRMAISREFVGYWRFVENGECPPSFQAEQLEFAYNAKKVFEK